MPWGQGVGHFSGSTAPVSSNRIAPSPCACAPDAFRAGCGSGRSTPSGWLLGAEDVPLRSENLAWALRLVYDMSDIAECPACHRPLAHKGGARGHSVTYALRSILGVVTRRVRAAVMARKISHRYPCIFGTSLVKEHVDPVINELFKLHGVKPNWGDMRRTWQLKHCAELNPYGSESCPFGQKDCAVAFMEAVEETLRARPKRFGALFRYVANRTGGERADEAQRSRHNRDIRERRLAGHPAEMGGPEEAVPDPGRRPTDLERVLAERKGEPLSSADLGPARLGSLLGSLDFGPREPDARGDEGEEGTER